MKLTASNTAAIVYLLAALAMLSFWYVALFVSNPIGITPMDNLLYVLNEPPTQLIFWWLLVLPVLCFLLAAAYYSKWSQTRIGAFSLFGVGAALALAAWWSSPSSIDVFISLALWFGFTVLKPHLVPYSGGTR